MPRYLRGSEIDLDEVYGPLLNKSAHLRRNIRTGNSISCIHHCEDPECGGKAPSRKCILRGHFAFCLAPVVDQDHTSSTFKEVTIHGERFAVLSPQGCAEHHYTDGYNIDIKDARKGRHKFPIRWKKQLEEFRAQYEADVALEAEKREAMHKQLGMTGHQRQTMQARQDRKEYLRQREPETAGLMRDGLGYKRESTIAPVSAEASTRQLSKRKVRDAEELDAKVRAISLEEMERVVAPLWLYTELFSSPGDRAAHRGEMNEYVGLDSCALVPQEVAVPTREWLHDQLYSEASGIEEEEEEEEEEVEYGSQTDSLSRRPYPQDDGQSRTAIGSTNNRPRKRERKEAKKKRSSQSSSFGAHEGRGSSEGRSGSQ